MIVTAAHCLPHLPPAASITDASERSYRRLVDTLTAEDSLRAL